MQYYIYERANIPSLPKQNFKTGIHLFLTALIASTAASAAGVVPELYGLITAACSTLLIIICGFIYNRYSRLFKRRVLLQVDEDSIHYFSDAENDMVEISAADIIKIITRFCEIQIHTRDQKVHRISISHVKKEQTRWEIKEMVKQLAAVNTLSAVS